MKIINGLIPDAISLKKRIADITHDAEKRMRWFDFYQAHGGNARLTCDHFHISRDTFYLCKKRYIYSEVDPVLRTG
jgi:hypothetical protein